MEAAGGEEKRKREKREFREDGRDVERKREEMERSREIVRKRVGQGKRRR